MNEHISGTDDFLYGQTTTEWIYVPAADNALHEVTRKYSEFILFFFVKKWQLRLDCYKLGNTRFNS